MDWQRRIHAGDEVFGSDGRKIGTVRTVSPDYLRVTTGRFTFGRDYRIPDAAIRHVEPGRVDLNFEARTLEGLSRAPAQPPSTTRTPPAPAVGPVAHLGKEAPGGPAPASPAGAVRPSTGEGPGGPAAAPSPSASSEASPIPFAGTIPTPPAAPLPGAEAPRVPFARPPVTPGDLCGQHLRDLTGKPIGKIKVVGPDYAMVPTGWFGLGPILFVPFSQIARNEHGDYYVTMTREQIRVQGWTRRPGEDVQHDG